MQEYGRLNPQLLRDTLSILTPGHCDRSISTSE